VKRNKELRNMRHKGINRRKTSRRSGKKQLVRQGNTKTYESLEKRDKNKKLGEGKESINGNKREKVLEKSAWVWSPK